MKMEEIVCSITIGIEDVMITADHTTMHPLPDAGQ